MRFVSLEVSSFQGVKFAHVDFGPGLNVLYGPNDLGKSTLAKAIRAALLMPSNSADADEFQPWFSDDPAQVCLVFTDDSGGFWRVEKAFGGQAGAKLSYSKDGQNWSLDVKAREVDEKLRTLLPWGIATPGGKKAPRGLPSSFLSNALLGAQTEVDLVLEKGLEIDSAESGKLALTQALSALAQDPLFKQVLDTAQTEVDRFFTEKGKRKSGQNSALTAASDAVKKLQLERDELLKQVEQGQSIEAQSRALRERREQQAQLRDRAKEHLAAVTSQLAAGSARQAATNEVAAAQQALAKLDAQALRVTEAQHALTELKKTADAKRTVLSAALAAKEAAAAALKSAEDAERLASSEHQHEKRALERAKVETALLKLGDTQRRLEALTEKAAVALRAKADLEGLKDKARLAEVELKKLAAEHQQVSKALTDAEHEVQLAEGIVGYGRWRVASDAAQAAVIARAEAAKLASEAVIKEVEAHQLEQRAKAADDEIAKRSEQLPARSTLTELHRLAREKEVAEAALGGGVTVAVRPRRPIALHAVADDDSPVDQPALRTEKVIDAERRLQLSIGDLVDLEITAGAPEKRRALEALRRRWKDEVLPTLQQAGAASLADLEAAYTAIATLEASALAARGQAKALRVQAEALRVKAAGLEKQPSPSKEELEQREARIGSLDRTVLANFFTAMGPTWEEQCEGLRAKTTKAVQTQRAAQLALDQRRQQAEWSLHEVKRREAEAAAAWPQLVEAFDGRAPAEVQKANANELAAMRTEAASLQATLEELTAKEGSVGAAAKQAVTAARSLLERRSAELTAAQTALSTAEADLHARQGQTQALEEHLAELNRPAAAARVAQAQRALEALGSNQGTTSHDVEVATEALERAQAQYDEANEQFLKADGALASLAGPMVKERVEQLEEAVLVAQVRERELLVDADSWKLLRDALREAEKTESTHLGKALSVPVTERFTALTQGKYAGVVLNQDLKADAVVLNGTQTSGDAVLNALSVGTKDQLATLVRLSVASQLKSAIVLDDQLVHTDAARLGWFAGLLRQLSASAQVLIFTCRPLDYVRSEDLPGTDVVKDVGATRTIDLARVIKSSMIGASK